MSPSAALEKGVCLADYFSNINYVDQLTHLFLLSYLVVVLVRLVRQNKAEANKLSICDPHLIDAVCQISTVGLFFATFRILRKDNFNVDVPIIGVLMGVLLSITTFTFGISVGRSWGLAEAMLQGNNKITSPIGNRSKRTIRPKNTVSFSGHGAAAATASVSHYSSDDSSSIMSQSSLSRKKMTTLAAAAARKEVDDKKKQLDNAAEKYIYETVESAKVSLLSNLELSLNPSGAPSPSSGDSSEWKLVRTGYSSHIWLSKQRLRIRHSSSSNSSTSSSTTTSSDRTNNIMIKASCFSEMSVTEVALFLHVHDITTGLECLTKHRTPLQALQNNRVQVRRITVGSTLTVSKRDFVTATYWLEIPETHSVVVCTQSMPDSFSPKVKGVTRGTIHNCGFVLIPAAKAPAAATSRPPPAYKHHAGGVAEKEGADTDIRCLIGGGGEGTGAGAGGPGGCQILYFADIELGGSSGMAMRRATASKGDTMINSLHALLDQLHRRPPDMPTASYNAAGGPSSSVLDLVFQDLHQPGPGGLSLEQSSELRALSVSTSDRLKNLYCNAVGLRGSSSNAVSPSSSLQEGQSASARMRKTSVANRDEEFINDVDFMMEGSSSPFAISSPSPSSSQWTTFHDQDGISVSEFSHCDYPMDTLMASCHVEAAPHEVRRLLTESPEHVDGLLEQRDVLCRLDDRTSVQWIAYGAMWPIGARDFLVLTSESTFNSEKPFDSDPNTFHDSFILVSTSVDSIYEDIIESRNGSVSGGLEDNEDQPTYTRSYIRLAGYIGTKNKQKGGTDLRLFINLDIATYIPAWVMQIMSQYGLSEMMNRIRSALSAEKIAEFRHMTQLGNVSRLHPRGAPSKLNTIMAQIQEREEKLSHIVKNQSSQKQPGSKAGGSLPTSSNTSTPQKVGFSNTGEREKEEEVRCEENSDVSRGKQLAAKGLRLLKIYAGIVSCPDHVFDWQVRSKKGPIEVSTSVTPASAWIALRATTVIEHADVVTLRNFLFDDSNLSSIDDMLDSVQSVLRVDASTSIRHMSFKGVWPTAPRDFVLCTTLTCDEMSEEGQEQGQQEQQEEGASPADRKRSYVTSISAWDDLLPPQRGFVRGNLLISGYVIEAVPGRPESSRVTMCAHSDLGGQLPSSLINALSVNAPIKILTAISEVLRAKST